MSICEGIVQVLEEQACAQNYKSVGKVWLEIGPLAGVELESLRFCFEAVAKGTLAEDAKLEIVETKGLAWCMKCSNTVEVARRFDACPTCGSFQLQVTGGDEMRIKELEVN
ncbi:MAG: hydrogenase maturation nickel metallochaperone HypA [bacterium]|nr:hydrogenase maturation nickel metallochaperone HypA [bacterium]